MELQIQPSHTFLLNCKPIQIHSFQYFPLSCKIHSFSTTSLRYKHILSLLFPFTANTISIYFSTSIQSFSILPLTFFASPLTSSTSTIQIHSSSTFPLTVSTFPLSLQIHPSCTFPLTSSCSPLQHKHTLPLLHFLPLLFHLAAKSTCSCKEYSNILPIASPPHVRTLPATHPAVTDTLW